MGGDGEWVVMVIVSVNGFSSSKIKLQFQRVLSCMYLTEGVLRSYKVKNTYKGLALAFKLVIIGLGVRGTLKHARKAVNEMNVESKQKTV